MMAKHSAKPKLTLGPALYNWSAEKWRDFYFEIADEADLDVVYLGEVVCQKRWPFYSQELPDVIERLEASGKQVVLSSLTLIMTGQDNNLLRAVAEDDSHLIEVNDISALPILAGRPFTVGPMVNVYNEGTLEFLAERGAARVCLPAELPEKALAALCQSAGDTELEVQAFGRIPLAISARCYHARSRDLSKSGCQYVCAEDPNGMIVETLDGEPFLAVNGTQTQSYKVLNLIDHLQRLTGRGITSFRLYPHTVDMVSVTDIFRRVLDGICEPAEAHAQLSALMAGVEFADGFLQGREGFSFSAS